MRDSSQVSLIIPCYRSSDDLGGCLESLREAGDLCTAEVIVVDDCSNDGTPEMVERDYPEVGVVRRSSNGGFARAVNTGIACVSQESEFIALLNSDATVEPGWLDSAIAVIRRDERVGAVAPRIVHHENPSLIESAGQAYTIAGWAYRRGHGERFGPPFDEVRPVLGPTGCAAVFRRRALDEQPFVFRDDLRCYYEDTELAFRLRRAGWNCLYVPDSIVRHKRSRSYGERPAEKVYHVSRTLEMVFWENVPAHLLWRAVWDHLLLTLVHGAAKTFDGQGIPYLRGKLAFLARTGRVRASRERNSSAADIAPWIERRWLAPLLRHRARE